MITAQEIHKAIYSKCIVEDEKHLSQYKEVGMSIHASAIKKSIDCPNLKQILFRDVLKVCKKYNLLFAPIERFTGTIPSKNLNDVVNFVRKHQEFGYKTWNLFDNEPSRVFLFKDEKQAQKEFSKFHWFREKSHSVTAKYSLFICAPEDQLIVKGKVKKNNVVTDDPIILAVETFQKNPNALQQDDLMFILTAWGLEALDVDIINERLN